MDLRISTKMSNAANNWKPELDATTGPAYEQIARALVRDIHEGRLREGELLPPHRELAHSLGVSVGTITRAYSEVAREGLLATNGRAGTRVRGGRTEESASDRPMSADIDLRSHASPLKTWDRQLREALVGVAQDSRTAEILAYESGAGRASLREAGARWIEHTADTPRDASQIILTNGAQHALLCSLLTCCRTGDFVAVEALTHSGLKAVAITLGLTLVPVEMDEDGLLPDALEAACRSKPIKVLVTVAEIHNPTTIIQPESRRRQIARVARKCGLTIIEDAVYAGMSRMILPPIAALLPDSVIRISGLSKTLGPGLRIGFIEAPEHLADRLAGSVKGTTWMASTIPAEIAKRLIESGAAAEILEANRVELSQRCEIVRLHLGRFGVRVADSSPHAWLELPAPWTSEGFVGWAKRAGILILSADSFAVTREHIHHAVRISVSAAPDIGILENVLVRLVQALLNPYGLADTHI
jgi:DNA-binding transcriptional MocR family regulator